MDILNILKETGKDLYTEDLDFFETELSTNEEYSEDYQRQCRLIMSDLRKWLKEQELVSGGWRRKAIQTEPEPDERRVPGSIKVDLDNLAPGEANPAATAMTPEQRLERELASLREMNDYKTRFKQFIEQRADIDAAFVDKNYAMFQTWELDAIISVRQMPEEFLEKYFGALDHDKIARYQQFSESFFMKHFSQLNPDIVLKRGKNDWKKKENRSKQLDVFLRLKGVKE